MEPKFGRLLTAMVTPFDKDLQVDYDCAAELAERLLQEGSDGLVIAGTTGESPTLSDEEKLQLFRVVKEAIGNRGSVIAGTGTNWTEKSIFLTREAEKIGVDAVLLTTPYYNKPSQEGLHQHYKAIAKATSLPVILYNIPSRAGRNIDARTTVRLAEVENIVGIKEASSDFAQIEEIRAKAPKNFLIYSGNDDETFPILLLGGCGVISVASHIAGQQIKEMITAFFTGEIARARELHYKLRPLFKALFPPISPNPAPVKMALKLSGFDVGGLRLPLVEVTLAERQILEETIEQYR